MTCTITHRKCHVAAATVLAAAMQFLSSAALPAAPPTAADEREAVAWCAIRRLRADLHLSTDDLAALACSEPQAETILSRLVSWYNTNRETLTARRAALHTARRALGQAQQKIRIGPRNETLIASIPTLGSAVTGARQALGSTLNSAATSACSSLTSGQRSIHQALATDPKTLTPSQKSLLQTARAGVPTHIAGVLSASHAVLRVRGTHDNGGEISPRRAQVACSRVGETRACCSPASRLTTRRPLFHRHWGHET